MEKTYAVFGLGQFGGSLVKAFYKKGTEVIGVDKSEEKVNEYSPYATYTVCANAVDENTLKQIGIRNIDHAFVSFGDDIEASILTSLLLIEIGVPQVWSKAQNDYHQKVLKKIGVNRIIQPEKDMANRIAGHITSEKMIDYVELSPNYGIVEIVATKKLDGRSLGEIDVRANYGCNIVGIKRGGQFIVAPSAEDIIYENDILIVIGQTRDIETFEKKGD
ncbi:TrkA family potassium uptake protein [Bacillus sonorensis]|uniref:Regulator KtrA n=2 Tax=Bacillus sonorensis TaxID=119858 RepID=M5NY32_9BACI|nr:MULTISPECIES: TrkA family potassium uptake protein [Bacillus]TWK85430.1 Ktr system potassium uptake protein A [Bacillus paralicheniformis]ASB87764.1 Ktr system potassium uptake protein [Bacillus sonorensis]EME72139.1 regulator KtrA [Bacillus sonorensis L12]MBG9913381.1 potassium transporter Trk [Bacillus sonorensis]MCF7619650.1 TrkA family potassium uptake protein [Bacillus sonorensis]